MDLRIGTFEGYSNNLQVATADMRTGYVPSLNLENDFNDKATKTSKLEPTILPNPNVNPNVKPILKPNLKKPLDALNEEKLSLTVKAIAVGLIGFMLFKVLN